MYVLCITNISNGFKGARSMEQDCCQKDETQVFFIKSLGIRFSRNMPQKVFDLLKLTLLKGHYGTVSKKTSCVETLELTAVNSAREWIMHVGSKTNSEITMASIFYKLLKDGSDCEAVICTDNPLIIKYSKSQENIKISLHYGYWNTFGVPQHGL